MAKIKKMKKSIKEIDNKEEKVMPAYKKKVKAITGGKRVKRPIA